MGEPMIGRNALEGKYMMPPKLNRTGELLKDRDYKMSVRFFYHSEVKRLRYDTAIDELTKEFFMTDRTIISILRRNNLILDQLYKNRPSLKRIIEECRPFICELSKEEKNRYNKIV